MFGLKRLREQYHGALSLARTIEAELEVAKDECAALREQLNRSIPMTGAEVGSRYNRVRFAEGLIQQLPNTHDGRNTWLLNYGVSDEAKSLRSKRSLRWDEPTQACETTPPSRLTHTGA